MRMPEPGPFGETFLEARARAIVAASFVNRPFCGWVETVVTVPTQRLPDLCVLCGLLCFLDLLFTDFVALDLRAGMTISSAGCETEMQESGKSPLAHAGRQCSFPLGEWRRQGRAAEFDRGRKPFRRALGHDGLGSISTDKIVLSRPRAEDKMQDQRDHREDQQQVDQSACNVEHRETADPSDKQDHEQDGPYAHVFLLWRRTQGIESCPACLTPFRLKVRAFIADSIEARGLSNRANAVFVA